jgi:hypothetical protein
MSPDLLPLVALEKGLEILKAIYGAQIEGYLWSTGFASFR